jgi:beta-galactosidase
MPVVVGNFGRRTQSFVIPFRARARAVEWFSVTATGTPPLHYQWTKNGLNSTRATKASYTTPPTTAADNGALFAVTVSNLAGSVTSNNAILTVR